MQTPEPTDSFAPNALSAAVAALDEITRGKLLQEPLTDDLLAGALALEWLNRSGWQTPLHAQAVQELRQMVCYPATAASHQASELAVIVRELISRG